MSRCCESGGQVHDANLIKKVQPRYPEEAKQRHITGMVELTAVIGGDGRIRYLLLVRGRLP
jgi:outer membrane biosynthesis protein TonB